jgi:hypothetical protein
MKDPNLFISSRPYSEKRFTLRLNLLGILAALIALAGCGIPGAG